MLARVEYEQTKRDIQDHADNYTKELRDLIIGQQNMLKVIQSANRIARKYHTSLTQTIFQRLREVGNTAIDYYAPDLTDLEKEQEVSLAIDYLVHNKYYGLTLPQRITQSHLNLRGSIKRSAAVGVNKDTRILNITRVFNNTYPFGAQKNWDTRLFLAEAVRLEHVIAKNMAHRKAFNLIRWTTSSSHNHVDICDHYAQAVDPNVVAYIAEQNLDMDPAGVYFLTSVPTIPHPNCQCVLKYIYRTKRGTRKRPQKKLNLIQRILRRFFK